MKRTVITNATLVLTDRIVESGFVIYEEGVITETGTGSFQPLPNDAVIDARGNYVAPGFIDIHTHGAGGHDFMDSTVEAYLGAAEMHARHGTTSLLPTTLTSTNEELFHTFAVYKEAVAANQQGTAFLGLHLEGPYFAYSQRGAQDPKYLRNPVPEEYNAILDAADGLITRWSMAPELNGALALGSLLRSRGILASIGHTDALYEEVVQAFESGFTHVTHLYSCMSTITRRQAYRYAGALEAAYMIDDMSVEVIADGVHVPQPLLQYVYKFKDITRIVLCTDSMRAAGMPDGEYLLGSKTNGQAVIVEDGVAKLPDRSAFAGSVATADRLVRTMLNLVGIPVWEAVRMITLNPASLLGIETQKGSLTPGKDADIVIFSPDITIQTTIVKGKIVYSQNNY